ncbi:zinc finger MYM-type protein 2-like [Rhizophagus clarus]|uniref:Zinc finger MYM-type protein 2-like n=1 Tax=Rhizophagus clarus TaxID=94130 RepID=A0A8H3L6X8_9GLOM|nr:zinc finger MYM-type protein 2-like [Rhizophagus clarus]
MAQDISPKGNHLPSLEQLSALAKGRVPQNTVMNTEKWVKIMNKWRADVNYNYPLESQDKDTIELQVTQFLCGVTSKNGEYYSRTSLKNALSAISRYLQDVKPGWREINLIKDMKKKGIGETKSTDGLSTDEIRHIIQHETLNPNVPFGLLKRVFFWICILGAPRGGEHVNLLASQLADTPDGIIFKKGQQKNDQGGVDGNQFDLNIPFPPDPPGIAGPNHDIRKFLSLRPQKGKCPYLYLSVSRSANAIAQGKWYRDKQIAIRSMFKTICVECNIDIKGRNICNHSGRKTSIFELFDLGIPENTGMAITGHHSVGGYRAYAKPNNSHKREALSGIVNRLNGLPLLPSLNTTSKRKNSINESDFSQSTSISESDSDFDVDESQEDSISNVSSFCTAKEIMEKGSCNNSASHAPEEDHIIMKKRKDYKYKKVMIVKKYYKNCTFNK